MNEAPVATPEPNLVEEALKHRDDLRANCQTVILGTVGEDGFPDASHSPTVIHDDFTAAIYVSELSRHTQNLRASGKASVLLIEDESKAGQIYARRRLTVEATVEEVDRESSAFDAWMGELEGRHGKVVGHLRAMEDFHVMLLRPQEATLVYGFGRAFRLSGPGLGQVNHVNAKGHKAAKGGVK